MAVATTTSDLFEATRSLAPEIEAHREESEQDRSLAKPLMNSIIESGVLRAWVPRSIGGLETDAATFLRVIEEVSRMDGATGWNVMILGGGGAFAGYMEESAARAVYEDPHSLAAGAFAPKGRAVPVDGGYRVTGRWPLASGCQHASWLGGGCVIFDGDTPRMGENGLPDITMMLAPAEQCEIIDTWRSGGLRGTGSHDIEIKDVLIPAEYTVSLLNPQARETGPLYRGPFLDFFGPSVAAVALGIARSALDEFEELAGAKTPVFTRVVLRERPTVQAKIAEAEATLRSAQALLCDVVGDAWRSREAAKPLTEEQNTMLRLASAHAAKLSAEATDIAQMLGGSTSVYTSSKLERCFRDVHTVTQHIAASFTWYERAGSYFLGLGLPVF